MRRTAAFLCHQYTDFFPVLTRNDLPGLPRRCAAVLRFGCAFAILVHGWFNEGKIAIVTGANSGIGKATVAAVADRGAKVILACRNEERAEAGSATCAASRGATSKDANRSGDLDSVRAFAKAFSERLRSSRRARQ
jgi:NADPH:quinone reductase-like Zn-dependent oxidoreductase